MKPPKFLLKHSIAAFVYKLTEEKAKYCAGQYRSYTHSKGEVPHAARYAIAIFKHQGHYYSIGNNGTKQGENSVLAKESYSHRPQKGCYTSEDDIKGNATGKNVWHKATDEQPRNCNGCKHCKNIKCFR